jgi:predicted DNA-binding protein
MLMAYWVYSERQRRRELADRERGTEDHIGEILSNIFKESENERLKTENERLRKEKEELKRRIEELEEEVKRRDPFYDANNRLVEMMKMGSGKPYSIRLPREIDEKLKKIARENGYKKSEIVKLFLDSGIRIYENATTVANS